MKKKVNFYISKPEGLLISQETKRFGFRCNLIGRENYTLNEINAICDKLQKEGLQIEISVENPLPRNQKINVKCGECIYFDEDYGCSNDSSKARSKANKTKLSKGCFWGVKDE